MNGETMEKDTEQVFEKAKELYDERKTLDNEYNEQVKSSKQEIEQFLSQVSEKTNPQNTKKILRQIPRLQEFIDKFTDREKRNEMQRACMNLGNELCSAMNREVRSNTIVLSDMDDYEGKCSITLGKFGYGIRKNVQSSAISSIQDVMEVLERADDVVPALRENGYDSDAQMILKLREALEPLQYLKFYWDMYAEIPVTPVIGFAGSSTSAKPISINKMYFKRYGNIDFVDDSIGKHGQYIRHSVNELDGILAQRIVDNDKQEIANIIDSILEFDIQDATQEAMDAVKKQRMMNVL